MINHDLKAAVDELKRKKAEEKKSSSTKRVFLLFLIVSLAIYFL